MAPALGKEFLDIQANYRVRIHSETRTWHDNNIQSEFLKLLSLTICTYVTVQYILFYKQYFKGGLIKLMFISALFYVYIMLSNVEFLVSVSQFKESLH